MNDNVVSIACKETTTLDCSEYLCRNINAQGLIF